MSVIEELTGYAGLILGTIVAFVMAGIAIVFYFVKVRKVSADEELINYDKFERTDINDFCKFKDIISGAGNMGVIMVNDNTFVAGIEVQGYNFGSASADERQRTMINSIAFFDALEDQIQMCQNVRAIDISRNINEVHAAAERIERSFLEKRQEARSAIENLEAFAEDDELFQAEQERVEKLIHTMSSLEWQLSEAREIEGFMEHVSRPDYNARRTNQILFSYYYSADEDLETLSQEEIIIRAEQALRNRAGIYGSGLENCGCSWKILTADDLTILMRKHFHPLTGDTTRIEELLNSSYNSLYVSTNSLEELERERRSDIEYERLMQDYNERLRVMETAAEKRRERTVAELEMIRERDVV